MRKTTVLCILDGLGLKDSKVGNAFKMAKTPHFDDLLANYPNSVLQASGEYVGLPDGQIGNSEVGHLCIGAGEIVYTGLNLINNSLKTGDFYKNKAFLQVIEHVKKNNSALHLMGLLSPGGVHSLEDHLFALIDLAHEQKIEKVYVHAFGDGRDVSPRSIKPSIQRLQNQLNKYGYELASICGRYYSMDRDTNFELIDQAYEMLLNNCDKKFSDGVDYIENEYGNDRSDEFLKPATNYSYEGMKDGDGIIFFNYRPDRARELTHYIIGSGPYEQKPKTKLKNICLVSMMRYEGIKDAIVAFDSMEVKNTIGSVLAQNKKKQLRIAETQKYAHVTFFMDGGMDVELPNSKRIMIPSLKVESYATAPQMSAREITEALINELNDYDVVIVNYANCDMVGHTGDLQATIKAVEIVDECIGKLKTAIQKQGGTLFITADHGNAETMFDEFQKPATKHTTSPVFFITTDRKLKLANGSLPNVAPTILDYLEIPKPDSMNMPSLIIK